MQVLHQLLKYDLLPDPCATLKYPSCSENIYPDDIDVVRSLSLESTQELLHSDSEIKQKIIYIAGYVSKQSDFEHESEECVSSKFLDELNRGGLQIPTMEQSSLF